MFRPNFVRWGQGVGFFDGTASSSQPEHGSNTRLYLGLQVCHIFSPYQPSSADLSATLAPMSDQIETPPQNWYYATDGQTHGPFEEGAMAALISEGVIIPSTWVMDDSMSDWIGADQSLLVRYFPAQKAPEALSEPIPSAITASDETRSHRAVKLLWRRRKVVIITAAVLVGILLIVALIANKMERYESRRGNPANAIYPIIGESEEDFLLRFKETKGNVEPDKNGLSKVLLYRPGTNEGTFVYLLDKRVVAFRIEPLPAYMDAREKQRTCTLEHSQTVEGYIRGDYHDLETIKSEGNSFKDRFGNAIWFLPFPNGSLLVFARQVADQLGLQSIKISTSASPDESSANATPAPPPVTPQSVAVADQEIEVIRPYARFRIPRSYTFVRSFRNEAEDVVILARKGRNDGATVLVPDVQLSFCTDQKRFEEYVRYGSADIPETATLTAILNTLPQENFNGNIVRIQQSIIGGKVRNTSYQHLGTNGGVSFSFRLRTIDSNKNNDEQIDYSTLVNALKATLSLERHTDDETRANEATLSGKRSLSTRGATELNPLHKTLPELEEVWGKAKLAPAENFKATDFRGLLPKTIQRRYFFDSLPDPFNEIEQVAAYFLDRESTSYLMVFFGTHSLTEHRIIELLDHFAASGTWHRSSRGQWVNTQARLLALIDENTVSLLPSEVLDRQNTGVPPPAERVDPSAARSSPPTNTPPVDSTTAQPKRRQAQPGTFFLLQYASVKTSRGVYGFEPGHEVHLVRTLPDKGTVIVSDGKSELEISPSLLTNDLDVAAQLAQADAATQAQIVSRL